MFCVCVGGGGGGRHIHIHVDLSLGRVRLKPGEQILPPGFLNVLLCAPPPPQYQSPFLLFLPQEGQPSNAVLYANRASAYLKLKSWAKAVEDAQCAVAKDPTWPKVCVCVCVCVRVCGVCVCVRVCVCVCICCVCVCECVCVCMCVLCVCVRACACMRVCVCLQYIGVAACVYKEVLALALVFVCTYLHICTCMCVVEHYVQTEVSSSVHPVCIHLCLCV